MIAVAALVAAACGGGDGGNADGNSGQFLPPRERLRLMLPGPENLPGFVQVEETFSTNEDLAEGSSDPEERLATLEGWGRILGADRILDPEERPETGPQIVGLQISASLYSRVDGAKESFAEALQFARETDWLASHPGFGDLQVRELELPDGPVDEALWLRITGVSDDEDGEDVTLFIDDFVFWRRGNARSLLRMASETDNNNPDSLLDLVEGMLTVQMDLVEAGRSATS